MVIHLVTQSNLNFNWKLIENKIYYQYHNLWILIEHLFYYFDTCKLFFFHYIGAVFLADALFEINILVLTAISNYLNTSSVNADCRHILVDSRSLYFGLLGGKKP